MYSLAYFLGHYDRMIGLIFFGRLKIIWSMTRSVTRGRRGLHPPGKMCWASVKAIGHSLKNVGPSQKTFRHPYCLKLVTGLSMTEKNNTQKPASCLLAYRGVTRGKKGHDSPGVESLLGAPNHCGGVGRLRRAPKSRQCHKYFLQ